MNQHLDLVSLYGTWSDLGGYQFLVVTHPSGTHYTVINLNGYDYGGGASAVYEITDVKGLDAILSTQGEKDQYAFKQEVMEWCKSQVKDSLTLRSS